MKILKNKIAAIAISIFFILSMTGSMMLSPSVKGASNSVTWSCGRHSIPTFLYLNVGPNPIGVGQTVNLNAFFGSYIIDTEIPGMHNPQNYNVTVTTPSGTTSTLTLIADKTGGGHVDYVPTSRWHIQIPGLLRRTSICSSRLDRSYSGPCRQAPLSRLQCNKPR